MNQEIQKILDELPYNCSHIIDIEETNKDLVC
jgi:hypothetical protein